MTHHSLEGTRTDGRRSEYCAAWAPDWTDVAEGARDRTDVAEGAPVR